MSHPQLTAPDPQERFAASGQPYLPVPLSYGDLPAWDPFTEGELVARYTYVGPDGEPRFEVLRFHCREGHSAYPAKRFLSRRYDAASAGWVWGLEGVELLPFRLPRVLAAVAAGEPVFVVEGEKDVLALEAAGLVATCNPLGGLQWRDGCSEWLRGADVAVIPDNDPVGRVHAARVAESLRGRARSLAVVLLPGVAPGGDASTWLAEGHDAAELRRLAEAAPRDPGPEAVAALLGLPAGADVRNDAPRAILDVIRRVAHGDLSRRPPKPFSRTRAIFTRLGVELPAGEPDARAVYRRLRDVVATAPPGSRERLADAFALERAIYELSLVAPLVLAIAGGESAERPEAWTAEGPRLVLSPAVRLVRTRWDWEGWLAGGAPEPTETGAANLIQARAGGVRVQGLSPLAAAVAGFLARPRTAGDLAAALARSEEAEGLTPAQLSATVLELVRQMGAASLVQRAPDPAAHVAEQIRSWTCGEAAVPEAALLAGRLVRAVRAAGEQGAGDDGPDPVYRLDLAAALLDDGLRRAGLGEAFGLELGAYWSEPGAAERRRHLRLVLDAMEPALHGLMGHLPPLPLS